MKKICKAFGGILSLGLLLILPMLTYARSGVSAEYQGYLDEFTIIVEEAILDQDSGYLVDIMSPALADDIGTQLQKQLEDIEILEFQIYDAEYSQIDAMHYRIDTRYSIKAHSGERTWSTSGLSLYMIIEDTPEYLYIADTNLLNVFDGLSMGDFSGAVVGVFFAIVAVGLLFMAFWIWMLVDVLKRDIPDKTLWVVLIVFTNWIGAFIYFFVVRKKYSMKK